MSEIRIERKKKPLKSRIKHPDEGGEAGIVQDKRMPRGALVRQNDERDAGAAVGGLPGQAVPLPRARAVRRALRR